MPQLTYGDVKSAATRIAGQVRPVSLAPADPDASGGQVWFACEFMQHTGTFKARGAANFTTAHRETGTMPEAGVVIASGGNAGMACAWAAARHSIPAAVFLPETSPAVKVAGLRALGAQVHQVGTEYTAAFEASRRYAATTGALESHAYDHPLIAAGAGTLLDEVRTTLPGLDTVIVAAGGGGLFAGTAAVADHYGIRTVAVEPEHSRALNAALLAGAPVPVSVRSIAADALGARVISPAALYWAQRPETRSVLVPDDAIAAARQRLWDEYRIAVEPAGATAFAALLSRAYVPAPGEKVCVVLCGANTDPGDLVHR
ncbi:serine/threonine dehydratase [Streptomyces noursei]|uniref:serine/threonine dehydratase n=1 Tax=Streptomyces noursei TaxID=1971 RepID=UPI00167B0075|nr:serine/threonine dehydratase [Streptomyces noursei]MCZ1016393.1 serine/threonine dehydratase [Streptomyces noursei]GGX00018.1 serine/threonine dehydratase [Streptomyces noursei]